MTGAMRTLIGRSHAVGLLRAEIARASASHGGLVLVTGEAGIGKTTLVTEAVGDARQQGALVLSGSCWDSGSTPGYWPWTQIIRALRRTATPQEWAAAQEAGGSSLAVLLEESPPAEQTEAFRLFDAVTTALVTVAQSRALTVVLEDLHWADTASLKLLEFVAQHTWFERLLLVGTYRDAEVESDGHPLHPLLLPLLSKATTVTLTGLSRDEVGELVARTIGHRPEEALISEVHRRTGGNPFFVEQTVRLWQGGGPVTAIAPGVREAVRRRLPLLPEPVVRLLTAAAVLDRVESETAEIGMRHIDEQTRGLCSGLDMGTCAGTAARTSAGARTGAGAGAVAAALNGGTGLRMGSAAAGNGHGAVADAIAGMLPVRAPAAGPPGAERSRGPVRADADAAPDGSFRFDGTVWSLTFAGRTVHMPDAKGLHDLRTLLSHPGTDLPALLLLGPVHGDLAAAARRMGSDPVLDEEAKARYKRHLDRLDEEIDRAAERGDQRRAAEYARERAALLHELRTAAGLGGRSRRLGDEAERARKTVTARIRDTLRRLDGRHPELAAHLRATVSTGLSCRYAPTPGTVWRL